MKKLILTLVFLVSAIHSEKAHAIILLCGVNPSGVLYEYDQQNLVREIVGGDWIDCDAIDIKSRNYFYEKMSPHLLYVRRHVKVNIIGSGLGLRYNVNDGIMITCPLVFSPRRLSKSPFYGVKVSVGAIASATAAVFSNKRLGVCVLTGVGVGAGAGISGAEMTFKDRWE